MFDLHNTSSTQKWHGDVLHHPPRVSQSNRLILERKSRTLRASECCINHHTERFANIALIQILKLGSLLKEPKTDDSEVQQFRAKVATDRKQLKALLDQRMQHA
jgi:hypothetical protein